MCALRFVETRECKPILLQRCKTDLCGVAVFPRIGHTFVSMPVVMVAFAQKESLKGIDND
ncbi:MAG: hypothetical protein CBC98_01960 [Planctomycetaceae bacterium TMED138]|nr:MAG: hypothetical protein CBC98_01960 [Planctomycetaceae bacterium TMED138]